VTVATLTSKGQITIPKEIRNRLMLQTGDQIDFQFTGQGQVLLRPLTRHVDEVFGRLSQPDQQVLTPAEMDAAVKRRTGATL
jgi:antitoxin PrlF